MGLRGKISLSRSAAEHFPIEFSAVAAGFFCRQMPTDYEAVSEPGAVATGSGRAARFVSDRFSVILFREVSFLIRETS